VVVSVLFESLLIGLAGGLVGSLFAYFDFQWFPGCNDELPDF